MAKKKASPKFLATLDLIRAVYEGDHRGAADAVARGGDPRAYAPEGARRLFELPHVKNDAKMAAALKPKSGPLLPFDQEPGPWREGLLQYAILRGWRFATMPAGNTGLGSETEVTEAVALGLAGRETMMQARVSESVGGVHKWQASFETQGRNRPEMRLEFYTSASGDALNKQREAAEDWCAKPAAAELEARVEHEGARWGYELLGWDGRDLDRAHLMLKRGANPHLVSKELGGPPGEDQSCLPKFRILMREIRRLAPEGPGWREKLDELTKKKAWDALLREAERQELNEATPQGTTKKTMRVRKDVL